MSEQAFNKDTVLSLALGYRFQWEPAQNCHVLLYPEGMVKLNGPAAEIIQRISNQEKIVIAELIDDLKQAFNGADLDDDVYQFLAEAYNNEWIRVTE